MRTLAVLLVALVACPKAGSPVPAQRAEVPPVEGAAADAPTTLDDKPRPQGGSYTSVLNRWPQSLNPVVSTDAVARPIAAYTQGYLAAVDMDDPTRLEPALATSWTRSDDGRTYTFQLRQGVRFADGRPFTSEDVVFSFGLLQDPGVQADRLRSELDHVLSVEARGDHAVVVSAEPHWAGLEVFAVSLPVLNASWYGERIDAAPGQAGFAEQFDAIRVPGPGAGPYVMPEHALDSAAGPGEIALELLPNPHSWQIQVHPERWNFGSLRWWMSDGSPLEALRAGHVDSVVVDPAAWRDEHSRDEELSKVAEHLTYDHSAIGYYEIVWNTRRPPFDDARIRTAMTHLVDRKKLLEDALAGEGRVARFPSKPGYPGTDLDLEPIPFDPDAARALLAEAGWVDTDGDGIVDRDGVRFAFTLDLASPSSFYGMVAQDLADHAASVGIQVQPRTREWTDFLAGVESRDFDALCLYMAFSDPWIDPYDSYHSSEAATGGNLSGWHSAEADSMLEGIRDTNSEDGSRAERLRAFHRLYVREQPETLLIHPLVGVLLNRKIQGMPVRPTGLRLQEAWMSEADADE